MTGAVALDRNDVAAAEVPTLQGAEPIAPAALFPASRDEAGFGGELGLRQGPPFTGAELDRIRELIKAQLVRSAAEQSEAAATAVASVPLERLHEVSDRYDHGRLLSKSGRILSKDAVDEIKAMSFFDYVRAAFGDFYLGDEDGVGHEQISFRIVRPGRREDVGSLHRDHWFWEFYGLKVPPGEHRAKMWTLICGDPDAAGLRLAPGSHRHHGSYRSEKHGTKVVFEPDFDWREIGLRQYVGPPGQPIFFNYKTLHVGSINRGDGCRVSIETTILFR